ncbi:PREDICTED: ATP synthase subunit s, mitochondrial [Vollenhovia emeryi]|uniref:ATP synthase subunit s, mitochondrial n=1 Tax=Vollenhovia emeryi TaxID=411798 RepID=UPI0005F39627|nr:PREDICTED: ATP synthase subunit s, mitochondrial [Vollenhovia emeryi]XP_011873159.1 PREDICTED: ATP synthase subunit s, mitochondrial [Vollenhovia emeryi]XP_011873161.1 PREDICTED: ATP synthase subunit s, mitochondrial [Vollenhovia emeryi]XP_011873162.1 PREDICTED: ATP synthase subunit s, mitochondrial [Vollenhovia emeryi]
MLPHIPNGLRILSAIPSHCRKAPDREFFYWLTIIFNRVDRERIQSVGPDRACAEWLLKNGASVRWKGFSEYLGDYNKLSSEENRCYIQAVDATDSGITHVGFPHFVGCRYIDEIKLVRCSYLYNTALPLLSAVKDTLTTLEIKECKSITDQGVRSLKNLKNLKTLKITGIPYLEDKASLRKELAEALPNCTIELK